MLYAICCLLSYLIGAIPAAYIVAKLVQGVDIREHGSGNVGATNVLRLLGKKWFVFTLIFDIAKGYIPVFICKRVFPTEQLLQVLCVVAVIAGHTWPIYLKFKGGKGVATSTGAFFALVPDVMLGTALVWFVMIFTTKIVSLSSISGAIAFVILVFILQKSLIIKIFGTVLALLVIYKHKANIGRLVKGEEPKIGKKIETKNSNKE